MELEQMDKKQFELYIGLVFFFFLPALSLSLGGFLFNFFFLTESDHSSSQKMWYSQTRSDFH